MPVEVVRQLLLEGLYPYLGAIALVNGLGLLRLLFGGVPSHHPLCLLAFLIFYLILAPTPLLLLLHLVLDFLFFLAYFCLLFIEFYLGSNILLAFLFQSSLLSRLGPNLLIHNVPHVLDTLLLEDGLGVGEDRLGEVRATPELFFVNFQQPAELLFIHLVYF